MPESKTRKKKVATTAGERPVAADQPSPRWLAPVMIGLMVLGLAWIVTFYLTSADLQLPLPWIGRWNLAVGFGLIIAGFGLTTRWK